ncbi:signal peptidase I [Hyphococcus sp.]|uniref:signal peptidase I n=1 Tax=Hyphococcus sp. TaxID=2038636 RepID=UPI003CCBB11E
MADEQTGTLRWRAIRGEIVFFTCILAVFMLFRTAAYGMYHIPSESMLPTLAVGDRILVNKFSYGYSRHSIPFSLGPDIDNDAGRLFASLPKRGDLVVFKHPATGETLIKRAVALPGDIVEIDNGRLILNGDIAPRTLKETFRYREHKGGVAAVGRFLETLPEERGHEIYERGDHLAGDDFGPARVPENNIFVMGDNRDNSLDSRFTNPGVGFLPASHLVGRADMMLFSLNSQKREPGLKRLERRWLAPLN